jgi:hypothetical protein
MEMITLTWFQLVQVLCIIAACIVIPPMVKVTRRREAEAREARRQDRHELAEVLRASRH